MDTLKTKKLQNQLTPYLFSFQYFVRPFGVASTAMYCVHVLIDKLCMYILVWNGRTHLANNTGELPKI